MVTDNQVRRLRMLVNKEETIGKAALKAGMDEETARKYLKLGRLSLPPFLGHKTGKIKVIISLPRGLNFSRI